MNKLFKSHYCHNGREQVEKLVDLNKNRDKMGNEVIKVRKPRAHSIYMNFFRERKKDNMIYMYRHLYSIYLY